MASVQVFIPNSKKGICGVILLTTQQLIQQLPSIVIPDMRQIQIMSNPGNAFGTIVLVDFVPVTASSWALAPGQSIGYNVQNADAIYVGTNNAGFLPLTINYSVEVD
jgi:hypothetical protein